MSRFGCRAERACEGKALRYFEDYQIGERRRIGSCRVSREEIVDFAKRFDPQPFHVDEEAAKASIFGELTGSSCHTFALTGLIHSTNPEKSALVANLGGEELRFPNPLRPEDEITLSSECIAARISASRPGIGIVTTQTRLTNQNDEEIMTMKSTFMVRRRPEA